MNSVNLPDPFDPKLLKLKLAVDNAYLNYYAESKNISNKIIKDVTAQSYPSPRSRFTKNVNVVSSLGVFYLFFPSMILFSIILIDITKEKENNLKNYMNLYGLSIISYWIGWLIVAIFYSFIISIISNIIGPIIFDFEFFTNTNFFVTFWLFFLFSLSIQVFGMFIASLINDSKYATTVNIRHI
jgi:hypothetical protein